MTPEEAIEALRLEGGIDITGKPKRIAEFFEGLDMAIEALKEVRQYRGIGTVEECREAVKKLKRAEGALNVILSGNYNDECSFCVHNDNPIANCQCICGDGSWCIHNAKWNGKTSEDENLEGIE